MCVTLVVKSTIGASCVTMVVKGLMYWCMCAKLVFKGLINVLVHVCKISI